jgi:DNA-binding protein HU-beta
MNKTELAAEVAERLNGVDPDARQYVDAVFDVIMRRVAAGERVQIIGFGTFDSVGRAARVGRNPRTGAEIQVAPSVSPRFHPGQTFRAQVTGGSPASADSVDSAVAAEPAAPAAQAAPEQDVVKPAKAKKADAAVEKPAKKVKKNAAKPAEKKAARPAEKKAPKSVKVAKKSAKAGKTGKTAKAAKAAKK